MAKELITLRTPADLNDTFTYMDVRIAIKEVKEKSAYFETPMLYI
jgi:hypothetical protein